MRQGGDDVLKGTNTHIHTHTIIHTYVYTYMHIYVHMHKRMHSYAHTHTHDAEPIIERFRESIGVNASEINIMVGVSRL